MKYFVIAGEASGDLHASNLMKQLSIIDADADFRFSGGDLMKEVAGKPVIHYKDMAFMGIINVLLHLRIIFRNFRLIEKAILTYKPDVVILIDYPSFNLRVAKFVKKQLSVPVYYYIPPKLWAWKEYRIHAIKKYIDRVFTIFPFETGFYKKHTYTVEYVGNPTVDTITEKIFDNRTTLTDFCAENGLEQKPIIALLPGSRKQEIKGCLQKMIKAASRFENFQIIISGAPGIQNSFYNDLAGEVPVVFDKTYQLLNVATAAVVNSGTATLETALANIPEVVVYHVPGKQIAYLLRILFIKAKYISLVNLIAGKEIVKELYAHKFTEENVRKELEYILFDENYKLDMLKGYSDVRAELGPSGAAKNAALKMYSSLKK